MLKHDDLPQLAPPTDMPPRRMTLSLEVVTEVKGSPGSVPRMGETLRATAGSGGGGTLVPGSARQLAGQVQALRAPRVPNLESVPRRMLPPGPHRIQGRGRTVPRMKQVIDADGVNDMFDPRELFPFWEDVAASPAPARSTRLSPAEFIASLLG